MSAGDCQIVGYEKSSSCFAGCELLICFLSLNESNTVQRILISALQACHYASVYFISVTFGQEGLVAKHLRCHVFHIDIYNLSLYKIQSSFVSQKHLTNLIIHLGLKTIMAPLFFLIELFSPFVEIQTAYFSDLTHADYIHNSIFESKQSCVLTM